MKIQKRDEKSNLLILSAIFYYLTLTYNIGCIFLFFFQFCVSVLEHLSNSAFLIKINKYSIISLFPYLQKSKNNYKKYDLGHKYPSRILTFSLWIRYHAYSRVDISGFDVQSYCTFTPARLSTTVLVVLLSSPSLQPLPQFPSPTN